MSEINTEIVGKIVEGYKILKPLGQGKFSTVYQAERQADQKLVALKIIKIFDMMDQKQREKCLLEVKLLQSVDHPNIVKYMDSFINDNELYIAIEWADRGDLKRLIRKYNQEGDKIEEIKLVEYTRQLASALFHMHEKRIIHRDLKPANILIFSDGNLKLGDLGLGRYMSDETFKAFSKVGTPLYMSPEVIRNDGYDFKSDVWSLGCVIYELITFKSPFRTDEKISLIDLFNKINKGDYPKISDEKYSNIIKDLVDKMLKVNPEERIGLDELIQNCTNILRVQEDKPRIDPFIVMEDICEKLRLIDYENSFCKKFKRNYINKYFFACNQNTNSSEVSPQFVYFYELCNWLLFLIKQNVNLNILQEYDIKFRKYDKKRTVEGQLSDLLNELKTLGIKIIDNSKFVNGYGEGICLIITQLLDKYLINQNFIFKKPKFIQSEPNEEIQNDFEEVILDEKEPIQNDKNFTQNNFNSHTNFYFRSTAKTTAKKRWNSAMSNLTQETNLTSGFTTETDNFKINPSTMIMETNIDPAEWRREVDRVEKLLSIPEYPELLSSQSDSEYLFIPEETNFKKMNIFNNFLDKQLKSNNLILFENLKNSIEEDLKNINLFETRLSTHDKFKDKLAQISAYSKNIDTSRNDYITLNEKFETLKIESDYLEEKLKTIRDKNENNLESSLKDQMNIKKSKLRNLKEEIIMLESKNSFINSKLWQLHKSDHITKTNPEKSDKLFPGQVNEDIFDEIL